MSIKDLKTSVKCKKTRLLGCVSLEMPIFALEVSLFNNSKMNISMKRILFLLVMMTMALGVSAQEGRTEIGGNLSFGTKAHGPALGVKLRYNFDHKWRGEINMNNFMESDYLDMWDMNFNMHYLFPMSSDVNIYPIGGLTITNWGNSSDKNHSTRYTRMGINLGVGGEYRLAPKWTLTLEMKGQLVGDGAQSVIAFGVAYRFR